MSVTPDLAKIAVKPFAYYVILRSKGPADFLSLYHITLILTPSNLPQNTTGYLQVFGLINRLNRLQFAAIPLAYLYQHSIIALHGRI